MEVGDPYVYAAEGSSHSQVSFRLVVFRPFIGEVLCGKLVHCNRDGVRVSLGFFDDIFIPSHLLQQPSEYNVAKNLWTWKYGDEEGSEWTWGIGELFFLLIVVVFKTVIYFCVVSFLFIFCEQVCLSICLFLFLFSFGVTFIFRFAFA